MTRPRLTHIVLGVSLLVLILTPVWFVVAGSGQSDAQVNSVGQSRITDMAPSVEVAEPVEVERIGTPVMNEETPDLPQPIEVSIPDLDVQSPIVPVGVDADGQVIVPEDIDTIGWYKFGATPGSGSGSSVLVGHRDGRNYGKGAFYNLGALEPGDTVSVRSAENQVISYTVTGRDSIYKQKLPVKELFRETGEEVLTLISCVGAYVPGVGYDQNVIITAVPSSGS